MYQLAKLPEFKTTLTTVGNSKAIIIPAKVREDYGVHDDVEYWVDIRFRKAEGGEE